MMNLFLTHSFSLHTMLIDGWESCWLLTNYCDYFFYCCLNSHSDGTYSLQKKPLVSMLCNATFLQIFSDFKLIYILNGLKVSKFWFN